MKAVYIDEHGGYDKLKYSENFQEPQLRAGEVLLRNFATTVNHVDTLVRSGYPGIQMPLPHIPGGDLTGEIVEVSKDVKEFKPGQRVVSYPLITCGNCVYCRSGDANLCASWQYFGLHRWGGYAEYVAVPAESLIPLPNNVDFSDAATLPVAGLTAYHALFGVSNIKRGDTFLVWGGSGGVASFAIQMAKAAGARVITSTMEREKVEKLRELGADLILTDHDDQILGQIKDFTNGDGVDVAMDYVGPKTFATSFDALKKGGKLLLLGQITGRETTLNIHMAYLRHISILGLYLGRKEEMGKLISLVSEKKIRPVIFRNLPLNKAAEGQKMLKDSAHFGKIVLTI